LTREDRQRGPPLDRTRASDVARYYRMTTVAVIPCVLAGMWCYGLRVPVMLLVVWAAGAATEYGVDFLRKRRDLKTFWVMGLLLVSILPPGIPLWMAAVGMIFATLVGKEIFGGAGCYVFSPVLLGRYFLTLSYPAVMTGSYAAPGQCVWRWLDVSAPGVLTRSVPLLESRSGDVASLAEVFFGGAPGCIGETVAAAVLIGGVFLLIMRVIDWRIVLGMLASFGLLETLLMPEPIGWHLISGVVLFGAFFLAADPAISPSKPIARVLYGVLIGTAALLIRRFGVGLEDVTIAILVGNMLTPFLDRLRREAPDVRLSEG